jgi:hypothetical protein
MGCRILVGTQSIDQIPLYFQILNRRITPPPSTFITTNNDGNNRRRARWIDICLTRKEAFIVDNKLTIFVGASGDKSHITSIDSVLSYGQTKESLNWTKSEANLLKKCYEKDKAEQEPGNKPSSSVKSTGCDSKKSTSSINNNKNKENQIDSIKPINSTPSITDHFKNQLQPKPFDLLLAQSLDVVENCIYLVNSSTSQEGSSSSSLQLLPKNVCVELMSLICPPLVLFKAKTLLFNILTMNKSNEDLFSFNSSLYLDLKDESLISLIFQTFQSSQTGNEPILKVVSTYNSKIDYLDEIYDLEVLQKVLLICKSLIHQQRSVALVKFLTLKFSHIQDKPFYFIKSLNALFWRLTKRYFVASSSPTSAMNAQYLLKVGIPFYSQLPLIVESLVEVMHSFLLLNNNDEKIESDCGVIVDIIVDFYMKLLCANYLDISFTTRRILLQLLKPIKKSSSLPQTGPTRTTTTTTTNLPPPPPIPSEVSPNDSSTLQLQQPIINELNSMINEEDEMLQLAMTLSLNEQKQQQQQASDSTKIPPETMPRTIHTDLTNASSSTTSIKFRKSTVEPSQSEILTNNNRLYQLRKVLLDRFS